MFNPFTQFFNPNLSLLERTTLDAVEQTPVQP